MRIAVSIGSLAVIAAFAGFLYQWFGARLDRRKYAASGRWIEIGSGNQLYMLEKGKDGPTVVFEAGIGATHLNWTRVQGLASAFAHTISYDRAGLGWSSPVRSLRTPAKCAAELHAMLEAAKIPAPYVLVGHSFGGLVMRRFALDYPEEVTSIVLVDPMRCEEWPPINAARQREVDRGCRLTRVAVPIARVGVARFAIRSLMGGSKRTSGRVAAGAGKGGRHVLNRVTEEVSKLPRDVWPVVASHWSRPGHYTGMRNYVRAVPHSVREMQDAPPIREIPVLLLTPGKSTPLSEECLRRIGDNVQQVIAPASAHWIHLDEPELVIGAIREMAAVTEPLASPA